MPPNDKKFWFRAKRYGWGWALPCAWQGWVVVGYIVLALWGCYGFPLPIWGFVRQYQKG